jgi:hypothetical protein
MNVSVSSSIFNVANATCGTTCPTCLGYIDFFVSPTSASTTIGNTLTFSAIAQNTSGGFSNVSTRANWSSGNSQVASSQGGGVFKALNAGGFGAEANIDLIDPDADCPEGQHSPCPTIPWGDEGSGTVAPTLTSISPAHGVAGTSTAVTITGTGLSGATLQAGSGVTVSISSTSASQIQATFNIASNATNGGRSINATNNGQISNSETFNVQVPSSLSVVSDTGSTQNFDCRTFNLAYNGVQRQILYQVFDATPQPILTAGMTVAESFTPISNSCAGVSNVPNATSGLTDGSGTFPAPDELAICSSSCLPADASGNPTGSCSLSVLQTWTANGFTVRKNQITYQCGSITVTPQ